ncbi:uncharacterized protein LOC122665640 [Telopea speciosissima]|uniref:uncharacterized protein LOC122665640 n=1 Tax=Telopea speciosissima TaxID=54955 RepID=UPI001CC4245C|nr:uncharacterized protein LOC122665640 [Telopea speciosissima]
MKVIFWNIRGIRKKAGRLALASLIRSHSPEVVCITELKVELSSFPSLFFNKLGFAVDLIHNDRVGSAPNLWVVWKLGLQKPGVLSSLDQLISLSLNWNGQVVVVSIIHASCFRALRRNLFLELTGLNVVSEPWLVVGDFNATLLSSEKWGPGAFSMGSALEFGVMIDTCSLLPIDSSGSKFTWTNNRRRGRVDSVLDKSLCNSKWSDFFQACSESFLQRAASDHSPLLISSGQLGRPNNAPFRFHKFWVESPNFLKEFPNLDVALKEAKVVLEDAQEALQVIGENDVLFGLEVDAKTAYLNSLKNSEKLWHEKTRIKWLREGDRNSKFFHVSTLIKRSKVHIRALKDSGGAWVSDPGEVANLILSFFENFHKAVPLEEHLDLLDVIPHLIEDRDLVFLNAVPDTREIKLAMWDLDLDGLPGLDGFQGFFFRHCWDIIERDVYRAVSSFFKEAIIPKGVNNCFISLIPKVEEAVSLEKFCPICMGNFVCKIISKILASKLGVLLPRLISEELGAFQKGKVIFSNIGFASELANLMHKSVRGCGIGVKVDISKAYDSLSWDFLFKVLKKFGFSDWFLDGDGNLNTPSSPSSIWLGVRRPWSVVQRHERWIMGDGTSINFWNDHWFGSSSIAEASGLPEDWSINKKARVSNFSKNSSWSLPPVQSEVLKKIFDDVHKVAIPSFSVADECC